MAWKKLVDVDVGRPGHLPIAVLVPPGGFALDHFRLLNPDPEPGTIVPILANKEGKRKREE